MATREILYRNRRAVRIDNGQLMVTVTVEGGHIAEIVEMTSGVNPLWSPSWPSIEPSSYSVDEHPEYGNNSESKLLAGIMGHNLCLDIFGPPSETEYAAGVTVHGEASIVPYKIDADGATLRGTAHLPVALLDFEREISLEPGGIVRIREKVINLTGMDRPLAWTQHVTLGPPFIGDGTRLHLSARKSMVYEKDLSSDQLYQPGAVFTWPIAPNKDESTSDLSELPRRERSAAATCHLVHEDREHGFFLAWQPRTNILIGYVWRRPDFPWISLWEENRSRTDPPWNGTTVTRGIEFGASPFAEGRRAMIERGSLFGVPTYRWLPAKASAAVEYVAFERISAEMPTELPPDVKL